uniref:Uncharacterized protein n=1 Tax=Zea mays TaxID=4577 RepID=C4J265_MAIZE|nr:unknown [Zea mays]
MVGYGPCAVGQEHDGRFPCRRPNRKHDQRQAWRPLQLLRRRARRVRAGGGARQDVPAAADERRPLLRVLPQGRRPQDDGGRLRRQLRQALHHGRRRHRARRDHGRPAAGRRASGQVLLHGRAGHTGARARRAGPADHHARDSPVPQQQQRRRRRWCRRPCSRSRSRHARHA